jgi:hypothetical protein
MVAAMRLAATHRDEAVQREYNRYLMLFALAWKSIDEKYATFHRLASEKFGDDWVGEASNL